MKSVEFPLWDNEVEKISSAIDQVAQQVQSVSKKIKSHDTSRIDFDIFFGNLRNALNYWTGQTYVGIRKPKSLEKAFQRFFEALYSFLVFCRAEGIFIPVISNALYQGTLYRYLGHGSCEGNTKEKIEPEYNDVYVSWSKKPKNAYIQSKLKGVRTLITCELKNHYWGIDLEGFGVVRGEEAEVVFPTIKETMVDIKYIKK